MRIVKAIQTSFACPSQWDAWTDDGRYVYLRYRHGRGTVDLYPSPDIDTWELQKEPDASFRHGDSLDGYITIEDFCRLAGIELIRPQLLEESDE